MNYFEKSEIKLLPQVFYKNGHTKLLRAFCLAKTKRFADAKSLLSNLDCFEQDHVVAVLLLHCLLEEGRTYETRMLLNVIPRNKSVSAGLQIKAFS